MMQSLVIWNAVVLSVCHQHPQSLILAMPFSPSMLPCVLLYLCAVFCRWRYAMLGGGTLSAQAITIFRTLLVWLHSRNVAEP